ncbi:NHERF family PDZ scaffold protein 4b [Conger conger]|uniref:NHERF family PDZ scaffold protein 4b n=1 Tax=Conger conger TaxID=82655 RepID=UPI002A5AEAA7|nr:NHERF family PDZ scaffold protein 4b [Conger conger]
MKENTGYGDIMELTEKFTFNPKEGIDNPALVISDDAAPAPGPELRLCVLKRKAGESYGFHMRVESGCRGHVIRQVEPWGVAERAGLRDGDRLLEVNETFVDDLEHLEVAQSIQVGGPQLCLLVLGGEEYDQALSEGLDLRALTRDHRGQDCARPRLCHITRDPGTGMGISIVVVDGERGKYSVSTAPGGPAERAGVQKGDHLVWINGAVASELTQSAINKMVKRCGNHLTVLVIDSESEQSYARRRMPILPAMAGTHNLPHRPLRLHLVQGPDGYGFLLRQEKSASGRIDHRLREVDAESPAEKAGIQDGDALLAVNGEAVESMEHDDIVHRIRQSGRRVTLTIVHTQGKDFFTQLGLSPLVFCEEFLHEKEQNTTAPSAVPPKEAQADLPCPRLCVLERGPTGFGFHLGCFEQEPGTFVGQVALGGPGQKAGLFQGDVVVEVNGQNVEEEYLEDVALLVKEGGQSLSMLVVDRPGYTRLKQSGTAIAPSLIPHCAEGEKTVDDSVM